MKESTDKKQFKRMKFNTIKTIEVMNEDTVLQKVYGNKNEPFDYDTLLESANAGTLSAKQTKALKDIYEYVIIINEIYSDIYSKIVDKPEFNAIKTIKVINKDTLLQKVYAGKSDDGYHFVKLIDAAKANTLSTTQVELLKHIFQKIILFSDIHIKLYIESKEVRRKTPTRYGKQQLQDDIANQGGIPTTIQSTLLDIAALEKHKQTISYRCIQDHYKGSNKISDEQHQKIQEAVRTFNMALEEIL